VESKQELEIKGTLKRDPENGLLEIPIDRQVQIKLVGEQPAEEETPPVAEE